MADDTFNNDNQESLMGDDEFTEVEATVIEDGEEVEQEESLEAKINHGIGTLDINVGKVSETDFAREMRTSFLEYSMSVIVARALSQPACQWLRRHCRRHGHEHPAPQFG